MVRSFAQAATQIRDSMRPKDERTCRDSKKFKSSLLRKKKSELALTVIHDPEWVVRVLDEDTKGLENHEHRIVCTTCTNALCHDPPRRTAPAQRRASATATSGRTTAPAVTHRSARFYAFALKTLSTAPRCGPLLFGVISLQSFHMALAILKHVAAAQDRSGPHVLCRAIRH